MKIVEEQLLFECLEQFEAGVPLETLLAQHPHAAAEIEKFLAVFVHLQQLPLQPSLAAKRQSQKLFLQRAEQLRAEGRQARFSWSNLRWSLLPLASLALFVVLFGFTLLFASASTVPGDVLYGAKRWVESYQLEQAGDPTAVFSLRRQLNEERVREVKAVLRTNQTAELSFEGRINTKQGSNWVIAGVPVDVSDQTQIDGYAAVGALVLVNGQATNGHFYANRIVVLEEGPTAGSATPPATTTAVATGTATPSATVTMTSSATPTQTATPTMSVTPDDLGTPTATGTSTPTRALPTVTATATATAPAALPTAIPPTATPQPQPTTVVNDDNNSNDDNNDNSGSGGNDNNNDAGDNSGNDNSNDNSGGGGNDNSGGNDNNNDNDGDNDNDNDGSGGDNDNDNDNGNDNGRRDD